MATLNKREEKLLGIFLLSMDFFRRDPALEYTSIRTPDGHTYAIHKQFALKFLRWKFHRFFLDEQFKDDSYLVTYLSSKVNQQRLLNLIPNYETKDVDEKDLDRLEEVLQSPAKFQEAQINQFVAIKNTQPHINPVNQHKTTLKTGEGVESMESTKEIQQASEAKNPTQVIANQNQPSPFQQQPQSTLGEQSFSVPNIPPEFSSSVKNAASSAGIFFKKNTGKYLTTQRLATIVSSIIGGITGAGLTAGSPIGIFAGAAAGGALPSFINSGAGGPMLSKIKNGALDRVESLGNLGQNASNLSSNLRSKAGNLRSNILSPKRGGLRFAVLFVGFFFLFFGLSFFTSLSPEGSPPSFAGPISSTDLINCKFTRSGNSLPIKSSTLAGWINQTASESGIPAQVLASVAMHENAAFVANTDDSSDAIKNNLFCNRGISFCEKNGQVFHSKPSVDDPCTPDEIANGAKTATAIGLMQVLDIYNPNANLCSITENLRIAAAKLKASGLTSEPTEEQVTFAINRYYNHCEYGSFNYCKEVWQDLQNCKPASPPTGIAASCPVPEGRISTPSYQGDPTRGHCAPSYGYACKCGVNGRRAKAIDVLTLGKPIVMPTIEGQNVDWKLIVGPYPIDTSEGGGSGYTFEAVLGSDRWALDMLHLGSIPSPQAVFPSGTILTQSVAGHVHVTIGKNIANPRNPGSDSTDCDSGWLPTDFMCR